MNGCCRGGVLPHADAESADGLVEGTLLKWRSSSCSVLLLGFSEAARLAVSICKLNAINHIFAPKMPFSVLKPLLSEVSVQ